MCGIGRDIGWRRLPSVVSRLVVYLAGFEKRRGCDVIDLGHGSHWLQRDTEPGSGRVTRQAMRRLPGWREDSRY